MPRALFVFNRESSFVAIDRDLLAKRYELRSLHGRKTLNPFVVARDVWRSQLVFGWFAHWHTFLPVTFAWLMRRPSVLVVGGFDTANMPEIGYGSQRGGWRRFVSRWTMRRASRLISNSEYIRAEVERTTGIARERVTVVHHGVPDPFGTLDTGERESLVLTVGAIERANLMRKGLLPFVEAASLLPDVRFVLAGKSVDDAGAQLRAVAADNVDLTGWISDQQLEQLYRRASVYVQASAHEGFGMTVAEAMLAGCIPVTTNAGALPEVVGECGVLARDASPEALADAIKDALGASTDQREAARQRVLERFPLTMRSAGILAVTDELLGERHS